MYCRLARGLKRGRPDTQSRHIAWGAATGPDEEGIETEPKQRVATHQAMVAATCPDEEGIETLTGCPTLVQIRVVAATCPDEEGIETVGVPLLAGLPVASRRDVP